MRNKLFAQVERAMNGEVSGVERMLTSLVEELMVHYPEAEAGELVTMLERAYFDEIEEAEYA